MDIFKDAVITEVSDAITVLSKKGITSKMKDRRYYGISFCTHGQITYTHKGKDYISDNKHIIIIPKGQSYSLKCDKAGAFPVINFSCRDFLTDTFLLFPIENIDSFMKYFERIKKLILFPENHAKIMSIFYNMLYELTSDKSGCKIINPAIKYIKEHYNDCTLDNKTLAKICNISEVYLRKLFLKHLKTTPKQYICEIRISKAKQLLSEGWLKINAISDECGFSSQYHFCRFFKAQTSLTPTEYMKQNKVYKI